MRAMLSLEGYRYKSHPIDLGFLNIKSPQNTLKILRMMIFDGERWRIPRVLHWIWPAIEFGITKEEYDFCYVTVRHGVVDYITDDKWHVDGFSMRTSHIPETNYIWTDHSSTEWLDQKFEFPYSFDPLKHNIHWYIQDHADDHAIKQMKPRHIYRITPYTPHRRPPNTSRTWRTFIRVSFTPIEIKDDTCTRNPLFEPRVYNSVDFRDSLERWVDGAEHG